ncbi:MAG: hypothetical protein ACTSYC_03330 [Promethearchaeota archaeon]
MNYLHPGESESIQLAKYLDCILIIDDKKARILAEQHKIKFLTTADTLLLLLKNGIINKEEYIVNLARYSSDGWLGTSVYQKYLNEGKNHE